MIGQSDMNGDWVLMQLKLPAGSAVEALDLPRSPAEGEPIRMLFWRREGENGFRLKTMEGSRVDDPSWEMAVKEYGVYDVGGQRFGAGCHPDMSGYRPRSGDSGGPVVSPDGSGYLGAISGLTNKSVASIAADPKLIETLRECEEFESERCQKWVAKQGYESGVSIPPGVARTAGEPYPCR